MKRRGRWSWPTRRRRSAISSTFVGIDPEQGDGHSSRAQPGLRARSPSAARRFRRRLGLGDGLAACCRSVAGSTRTSRASCASCVACGSEGLDVRLVRVGPRARRRRSRARGAARASSTSVVELGGVPDERPRRRSTTPSICCSSPRSTRGSAGRRSRRWPRGRRSSVRGPGRSTRSSATPRSRPIPRTSRRWPGTRRPSSPTQSVRATLIERGLAHAAEFSWDRTAEQMIDVYRDVVREGWLNMCGIVGILRFDGRPVRAEEIEAMTDSIRAPRPRRRGRARRGRRRARDAAALDRRSQRLADTSRSSTRTGRSPSCSTARSTTTATCARAWRSTGTSFAATATPRCWSTATSSSARAS